MSNAISNPYEIIKFKMFNQENDPNCCGAAIQYVLSVGHAIEEPVHQQRKRHLDKIPPMLSKRGGSGCWIQQAQSNDEIEEPDFDLLRHLRFVPSISMVITLRHATTENVDEPVRIPFRLLRSIPQAIQASVYVEGIYLKLPQVLTKLGSSVALLMHRSGRLFRQ